MHQRKLIRDEIASILIAGNTSAGSNVFTSRIKHVNPDQLPAINVQAYKESADPRSHTGQYWRTLDVGVIIFAKDGDNTADLLDEIAEQVEELIINNSRLNGQATDVILTGTDMRLEMGDATYGGLVINFEVEYETVHQPELEDFDGVDLTLKRGAEILSTSTINFDNQ